ncbi:hypothetical protein Ppb6_03130 [Photorhabdus australis subsp. thailandensis]|uniref:Uncharacterized protein n=1 Tax=Photorhabdus australis subsp. thailandensis TaxID=2805096 RepID=A0A1C0U1J5_9GAMM|nr:hypothetical protein Ppb6_03130 [Photorhabdus australis subsp. thailandensis]
MKCAVSLRTSSASREKAVIAVPPAYTSKWIYSECQYQRMRNILAAGRAVLSCEKSANLHQKRYLNRARAP